ncbi:MAG: hypothetical protein ACHREM_13670, partial [Polyangiales bacterium]
MSNTPRRSSGRRLLLKVVALSAGTSIAGCGGTVSYNHQVIGLSDGEVSDTHQVLGVVADTGQSPDAGDAHIINGTVPY